MGLEIVERSWKGAERCPKRSETKEIILHCTATPEGRDFSADDVDSWHRKRGFACVGYHFLICRDGTVVRGRPEDRVGAHCQGRNSDSIGVCYVGGCARDGKTPKDTRTTAQKESLNLLVFRLMRRYRLKLSDVRCHNEFAAKACPSFRIEDFRADFAWAINSKEFE